MWVLAGSHLWPLLLMALRTPTTHAHDPADTPTAHAHYPPDSPIIHTSTVYKNPESVEAQAAVLEVMREDCEVKMREERKLFDARMRDKGDAGEGVDEHDDVEDFRVVDSTKASTKGSAERTENVVETKENSRGRKNRNQVAMENGNEIIREDGKQGNREDENQAVKKAGNRSMKENSKLTIGENRTQSLKENGSVATHCPTTFDDVYCWPRTPPDTLVTIPCPSYVQGFPQGSHASRYCTSQGTWFRLDGGNSSWTNYTQCSTTYIVAENANMTLYTWVPVVRVVSYVGYSVSLATLIVAFTVLACIKRLRCPRNTLHMHLFLSFICRAVGALTRDKQHGLLLTPEPLLDGGTWGCRLFTGLWQYFILANYAWILMEGLYLHNLIFLALFTDNSAITLYIVLGWGLPLVLVLGWVTARVTAENTLCWFTNERPWVFWTFIRGPISISIVVSFALFLNIARELLLKLKSSTTPESRKYRYRKWARSTLVLVPLFGVHYAALLGFTYFMGKNHTIEIIWLFTDQFFASFQGFFVATLYCLLNAEVRSELRKIWHHWRMSKETEKNINFHSAISQSRTYFSRGTGTLGTAPPTGRKKNGLHSARGDSPSALTAAKVNGSVATQDNCLSAHDKSCCDDANNQSVTVNLAVVELQHPRDSHRTDASTASDASPWRHTPPDGGDLECALMLHPLTHNARTNLEAATPAHDTVSYVEDGPQTCTSSGRENHDEMGSELQEEFPPPSTIIYDTTDSCEGSPLLANNPRLAESTF